MRSFATAVVIHEDGERVLLHQREDFRWWALPGGNIEVGESPGQAAIRETFEETGYQIEIDKFVGKYYRPQLNDVRFIYQGWVIGGDAIQRGLETRQVGWYNPDKLPAALAPSVREIIKDAQNVGTEPLSKEVRYPAWQIHVGKTLIWFRNIRNRLQGRV